MPRPKHSSAWLLLPHVNADLGRSRERHRGHDPPLSKFGMAEHDFVRADADLHAADRGLADAVAVHPDLSPGHGVERHRRLRKIEPDVRGLTRRHVYRLYGAVAQRFVDDLEFVAADGNHDAIRLATPEETLVLIEL